MIFAKSFGIERIKSSVVDRECYESSSDGDDAKFHHGHPRKHSRRMFGKAKTSPFFVSK